MLLFWLFMSSLSSQQDSARVFIKRTTGFSRRELIVGRLGILAIFTRCLALLHEPARLSGRMPTYCTVPLRLISYEETTCFTPWFRYNSPERMTSSGYDIASSSLPFGGSQS